MRKHRAVYNLLYQEIARRLLLHQEPPDISQAMAIPVDLIERILRRDDFIHLLNQLSAVKFAEADRLIEGEGRNLRADMEKAAVGSFDRLLQLQQTASSETLIAHISMDFLDRAGYSKVQKVETTQAIHIDALTAEVLTAALKREEQGRLALAGRDPKDLAMEAQKVEIGKFTSSPNADQGSSDSPAK